MSDKEKRLKELSERLSEVRNEHRSLQKEILCEENEKKIGLIYHIPFEIRIEERPYECLFKVVRMDEFGTLIGVLLGRSFDFGRYGYVIIEDSAFSSDQLGLKTNDFYWYEMLGHFKRAIEINSILKEEE